MKRLALMTLLTALAVPLGVHAATRYVDAAADPSVADGTQAHPYVTIQAGVDNAQSGDTVSVAAGVYATGQRTSAFGCETRVLVAYKDNIRIVGAGRGKTVIKGAFGSGVGGCGVGAVRCVTVENSSGVVISDVSLVGGSVSDATASKCESTRAGGLYADSTAIYLVDSEIADCRAFDAASMYRGTAVRTLIFGNQVCDMDVAGCSGGCIESRLVHSIVASCVCSGSAGLLTNGSAYNVTFLDNTAAWTVYNSSATVETEVRNSLIVNSALGAEDVKGTLAQSSNIVSSRTASKGVYQCVSPLKLDYRLLSTSDAIGAGALQYLANLGLPTDIDPYLDYLKTAIDPEGASLAVGAVQSAVVAAAGGLALTFSDGRMAGYSVDGRRFPCNSYGFARTPHETCVICPEPAEGEWFNRAVRQSDSTSVYTDLQNRLVLMANPVVGKVETNELQGATKVIWVDRNGGNDSTGTGETNAPFASLQRAADAVTANNVRALVLVHPGRYDNVTTTNTSYGIFRVSTKSKQIHFRAVSGPSDTFIIGEADPAYAEDPAFPGCGPDAVHGALLLSPGMGSTCLQGFTICGCRSAHAAGTTAWRQNAAFYSQNRSVVADCIISNNVSSQSVATEGVLMRVRALDNVSSNTMFRTCFAASSSFFSNNRILDRSAAANGVLATTAYHCTFFTDEKSSGRLNAGGECNNSIFDGGFAIYSATTGTGNLYWNQASVSGSSVYVKADPQFADAARGGAVLSGSPAIGGGTAPTAANFGASYYKYASMDVEGNPIAYDASGKPTIGAFQTPVVVYHVTVAEPANGGFALTGGRSFGELVLKEGESLECAAAAGTRPCVGVSFAGKEYRFDAADKAVIPAADIAAASGELTVAALYTTDWYLATDGHDDDAAYTGFRPARAKKTFAAVMPLMASGDTLHVAPGTYRDGEMKQNASREVASRVVIPSGVTVVSAEGPVATVIEGGVDCRCAYLYQNAVLDGFTLTNGQTRVSATSDDDMHGGAVLGSSSNGRAPSYGIIVRNCRVVCNRAFQGSAGKGVQFVNCLIEGNVSGDADFSGGAVVYQGSAYGCRLRKNTGTYGFLYSANVIGTTVEASNVYADGVTRSVNFRNPSYSPLDKTCLWNSVFAGAVNVTASEKVDCRNIVIGDNSTAVQNPSYSFDNVIKTNAAAFAFAEDGAPVIGVNPAVDFADLSLVDYWKDSAGVSFLSKTVDLNGGQRVYNGRLDAGAVETSWLNRYSELFSSRGVATVVSADPGVVAGESRVWVTNGAFTVQWPTVGARGVNVFKTQVLGTGTLYAYLDGSTTPFETVTAADGDKVISFPMPETSTVLKIQYVPGEGDALGALVGGAKRSHGFILMVK